MAAPIWKDYYVELTDNASDYPGGCQYRIRSGVQIIYQGRAFAAPGADTIGVYVNDICADLLTRTGLFCTLSQDFKIEILEYEAEDWVEVHSVTFRPDWSWDALYNPANDGCNQPINGLVHPLQRLPVSYTGLGGAVTIHNAHPTGSFSPDFNFDFQVETREDIVVTYSGNANGHEHWLQVSDYPDAEYFVSGGKKYTLKHYCGGVVLYYVNAYGYWDSFVPEGRAKVTDALTRHTRGVVYTNGPGPYARGQQNFANEIARKVVFKTGPLTTEQSSRMHHLLNSPYVIMYDTERGEYWPINLTGNNNAYQNAAGTLHFYDIEAVLAQDMIRR